MDCGFDSICTELQSLQLTTGGFTGGAIRASYVARPAPHSASSKPNGKWKAKRKPTDADAPDNGE